MTPAGPELGEKAPYEDKVESPAFATTTRLLPTSAACNGSRPVSTCPTLVSPETLRCVVEPKLVAPLFDRIMAFPALCGSPPPCTMGNTMGRNVSPQPTTNRAINNRAAAAALRI